MTRRSKSLKFRGALRRGAHGWRGLSVLRGPERPAWIAQSTNDAWFGSSAGPWQHLHQARMRAIEQGLPLVRSANTGISAVIDAHGRVLAALPLLEQGALQTRLPPPAPPTLYARTGDLPSALAILLCLGLGAGGLRLAGRRARG